MYELNITHNVWGVRLWLVSSYSAWTRSLLCMRMQLWQSLTAEQARTARSTPARLGGLQGRGRARHALQLVRGRAVVRARGEDALQVGLGRGKAARLRQDAAPGAASRASGPQEGLSSPSHALIRRCMPYPWSHTCRLTEPQ